MQIPGILVAVRMMGVGGGGEEVKGEERFIKKRFFLPLYLQQISNLINDN